jgi:hypothetical protein
MKAIISNPQQQSYVTRLITPIGDIEATQNKETRDRAQRR